MLPDLIDPLDGLFGRLFNGRMHRFTISDQGETCGMDVEVLLRRYHIRMWGRDMANSDSVGFLVKAKQARWAEYLMKRAGVPLTSPLFDHSNANVQRGPLPPAWSSGDRPRSFVDYVTTGMDALFGPSDRAKRYNIKQKPAKLGKTYRQ